MRKTREAEGTKKPPRKVPRVAVIFREATATPPICFLPNQKLTRIPISIARGVVPSIESCPKVAGALVRERLGSSSWLWFRMLFTLREASTLKCSAIRIFFFIPKLRFQYYRPRKVPYPPLLPSTPKIKGRVELKTAVGFPKIVKVPSIL